MNLPLCRKIPRSTKESARCRQHHSPELGLCNTRLTSVQVHGCPARHSHATAVLRIQRIEEGHCRPREEATLSRDNIQEQSRAHREDSDRSTLLKKAYLLPSIWPSLYSEAGQFAESRWKARNREVEMVNAHTGMMHAALLLHKSTSSGSQTNTDARWQSARGYHRQ
jgi:hypothetical protein